MKRWLLGCLCLLVLILGGCRSKTATEVKASDFSCAFEATLGDTVFGGTLTRYTVGTLELTFDKPETVDGLTASWDGETVHLRFYGLSFDVDADSFPEQALGEALVGALDAVMRGETSQTTQDGMLTVNGELDGVTYTLVCDGDSGLPRQFSVPEYALQVNFS